MLITQVHLKQYAGIQDTLIDLGSQPNHIVTLLGKDNLTKDAVFKALLEKQIDAMTRVYKIANEEQIQIIFNCGVSIKDYVNDPTPKIFTNAQKIFNPAKEESFPIFLTCDPCLAELQNVIVNKEVDQSKLSDENYENQLTESIKLNVATLINTYPATAQDILDTLGIIKQDLKNNKAPHPMYKRVLASLVSKEMRQQPKTKEVNATFDCQDLSLGEKEFFNILTFVLSYGAGRETNIFLLQDPCSHNEPKLRNQMMRFICDMIWPVSQIWIATEDADFATYIANTFSIDHSLIELDADIDWSSSSQVLTPR